MGDETNISWTDKTWPIVQGCDYESPGCASCYVVPLLWRHQHNPKLNARLEGLVTKNSAGHLHFTGKVALRDDRLTWPMKWKEPSRIFVPSHGDLFHPSVPDEFIDKVFAVMGLTPRHTYQVLTKRSDRMHAYCKTLGRHHEVDRVSLAAKAMGGDEGFWYTLGPNGWHLPNVWCGASVEDGKRAKQRVHHLIKTPAAKRFLSCEPLIEEIDLENIPHENGHPQHYYAALSGYVVDGCQAEQEKIHLVITGGESKQPGKTPRRMALEWDLKIEEQCRRAGVAFHRKQLGYTLAREMGLKDKAGADPAEWPLELRTQQMPR